MPAFVINIVWDTDQLLRDRKGRLTQLQQLANAYKETVYNSWDAAREGGMKKLKLPRPHPKGIIAVAQYDDLSKERLPTFDMNEERRYWKVSKSKKLVCLSLFIETNEKIKIKRTDPIYVNVFDADFPSQVELKPDSKRWAILDRPEKRRGSAESTKSGTSEQQKPPGEFVREHIIRTKVWGKRADPNRQLAAAHKAWSEMSRKQKQKWFEKHQRSTSRSRSTSRHKSRGASSCGGSARPKHHRKNQRSTSRSRSTKRYNSRGSGSHGSGPVKPKRQRKHHRSATRSKSRSSSESRHAKSYPKRRPRTKSTHKRKRPSSSRSSSSGCSSCGSLIRSKYKSQNHGTSTRKPKQHYPPRLVESDSESEYDRSLSASPLPLSRARRFGKNSSRNRKTNCIRPKKKRAPKKRSRSPSRAKSKRRRKASPSHSRSHKTCRSKSRSRPKVSRRPKHRSKSQSQSSSPEGSCRPCAGGNRLGSTRTSAPCRTHSVSKGSNNSSSDTVATRTPGPFIIYYIKMYKARVRKPMDSKKIAEVRNDADQVWLKMTKKQKDDFLKSCRSAAGKGKTPEPKCNSKK